jgi:PAS domain S-box-containing protein
MHHKRDVTPDEERMVQLMELAHDAVIVRDPENRIQFWNRGAERLDGWTAQQARGQVVHVLLPTRFPSSREAVAASLAEAGQWEGLLRHTSRDGKEVIVESRRVLVRGAAGEPEAILEINRDVTERERLLQEREEARANELAANEASRRMDEFIAIASHELKTPLTSIKGNLQLARRRLSTVMGEVHADDERLLRQLEGVQTMLERAERQVGVQNRLVSDLVDVSRIQTGKLELQLAMTDLATVVREVVADQRFATPMRLIALETSVLVANALADGERIGQVVSNYLSNALKYSPAERPVAVRLVVQGELVRVEVADEGPGLSAEQQARIWERFYRVPEIQVQSGSGVGLGLGLHICRMIIAQHHGEVGVQSTPGKGSTFWLTLPLWREHETASDG